MDWRSLLRDATYMDRQFIQLKKVLARNVRARRKELALSQEALAFEADVDRTYISQIERSIINPSLLILYKVATALETNVPFLLTEQP